MRLCRKYFKEKYVDSPKQRQKLINFIQYWQNIKKRKEIIFNVNSEKDDAFYQLSLEEAKTMVKHFNFELISISRNRDDLSYRTKFLNKIEGWDKFIAEYQTFDLIPDYFL